MSLAPVAVSLPPGRLAVARSLPSDVELKFSWEDDELLLGERDLRTSLSAQRLDPSRVASVHLPPGTETRGRDVGMALTPANRGPIVDFVHDQLGSLPDVPLVAHPPKRFEHGEFARLLQSLLDATERRISVENAPVESAWYHPEQMAFFARLAAARGPLDGLRFTVDSAHLPRDVAPLSAYDERVVAALPPEAPPGFAVGGGSFEAFLSRRLERVPHAALEAPESPYAPLAKTLSLVGDAVRSVHLNDPTTDDVPDLSGHGDHPVLRAALSVLDAGGGQVVLEPGSDLLDDPRELRERVEDVAALVDASD